MKKSTFLIAALAAAPLLLNQPSARAGEESKTVVTKEKVVEKAAPLPLHTIEGVGGIVITPVAYLVNPGPAGTVLGLPSFSATYVKAGDKNIETFALTETLFGRLELGYAPSRFGTGTLRDAVRTAAGVDYGRDDVYLHNINARFLALPEGSFGLPLPAVTVGASVKINEGIDNINHKLGGALSSIGLDHSTGVDFTVTATKAFPNVFGRPLLVTVGGRLSQGSQLGYLGFAEEYHATFEGNLAYSITDWLWLAAEFRQKPSPYDVIGKTLVRREQNWWTVGAAFVINKHATFTAGYGHFGHVLDTVENQGLALQFKYEL